MAVSQIRLLLHTSLRYAFRMRYNEFHATCRPELDVSRLSEEVMRLAKDSGSNTSSMLADVLAGRETEIDFINGQIVRMGKNMGVDVHENELVVQRIKELSN